jgi:hypothetical protein
MPVSKSIMLANGLVVRDEPVAKDDAQKRKRRASTASESGQGSNGDASGELNLASEDIQRGPSKSGRTWKTVRKEKASMAVYKPLKKTLGASWEKKQADKQKVKEARELQQELLENKKERIEKEQKRLASKRKRKAENELKNAKVQVMSHPDKIKKMSKKQLRSVYKTRMGEDGVVRLVGAYE